MNSEIKIIEPVGILAKAEAPNLRQMVNESLREGAKIVLIDFNNVTFVDSTGLGTLVMLRKAAMEAKAQLFLCSLNEQIKMLFELTDMEKLFQIYPNQEQFLLSYQN